MEPADSLPYLWGHATGPYLEQDIGRFHPVIGHEGP